MSETVLTTNWEFYDPERHAGQGGNYIFLLKAFGNAPYYSGETVSFADRLFGRGASHRKHFAEGRRTFMRQPFITESTDRSHAGFAARWYNYKQLGADERENLVWVPTNESNEAMGREGATFWANEVALLVSTAGNERYAVEKRVQLDIMDYYDRLLGRPIDWCIPPRSRLVGHGPAIFTDPKLMYQLNGGRAEGAGTFFSKLYEKNEKRLPRSMSGEAGDLVYLGKFVSDKSNKPVVRMPELELDLRFWAAISGNSDFCADFLAKSKFSGRKLTLVTNEKWHQRWYRNPETRKDSETDILLIFKEEETQLRFAFHIENKTATGSWEPQQAENYRLRAIDRMTKWKYIDFELVLIAPAAFISAHLDKSRMFDRTISYEELSQYIPKFLVSR